MDRLERRLSAGDAARDRFLDLGGMPEILKNYRIKLFFRAAYQIYLPASSEIQIAVAA